MICGMMAAVTVSDGLGNIGYSKLSRRSSGRQPWQDNEEMRHQTCPQQSRGDFRLHTSVLFIRAPLSTTFRSSTSHRGPPRTPP